MGLLDGDNFLLRLLEMNSGLLLKILGSLLMVYVVKWVLDFALQDTKGELQMIVTILLLGS